MAKKKNEYVCLRGVIGSSFVAYLLGATDINPLEPHYYCPECKTVSFVDNAYCGWDMPSKKCDCGCELERNGHNIPFESLRTIKNTNGMAEICTSRGFYEDAVALARDYFKENKIVYIKRGDLEIKSLVMIPEHVSEFSDGQVLDFSETADKLKKYPHLNILPNDGFDELREICNATHTSLYRINYLDDKVLEQIVLGNTDGIAEFEIDFTRSLIQALSPKSRYELIQIFGFGHSTGAWKNNAELLLPEDISVFDAVAYREDVFNYIQEKIKEQGITNTGIAYKIMEDTRRGVYARKQMPRDIEDTLASIGAEEWFVECLKKIYYLFPKAHGVEYVRHSMIMMWYKINYPKEFAQM